jgi:hypothetical protein
MRLGQTCVHTHGLWLLLLAAGVEFIDENGGGPGARLGKGVARGRETLAG